LANPERGTKRTDPETGKKFYDLNQDPIVSPYTGKSYPRSYFEQTLVNKPAPERARAEDDEEETEEEELEDAGGPEIISLEDADAEEAGDDDIPDVEDVEDVEDLGDDDDDVFLEEEDEEDDGIGFGGDRDEEP
jgi:uncharacterized protein (TIGR02300 family)